MLMQQSMIDGKYHGKPVTYMVMLMWNLGICRNRILYEWCTDDNNQQYTGNITGKQVTYLGMLTEEFRNLQEWNTM